MKALYVRIGMEDRERTNFACRESQEYRDDAPLDHTSSMHGPFPSLHLKDL